MMTRTTTYQAGPQSRWPAALVGWPGIWLAGGWLVPGTGCSATQVAARSSTYDADGNRTGERWDPQTPRRGRAFERTYTYDQAGMLSQVTQPGWDVAYERDGLGRATEQTTRTALGVDTETRYFDGLTAVSSVSQVTANSQTLWRDVVGNPAYQVTATGLDSAGAAGESGSLEWILGDHTGSALALTDQDGLLGELATHGDWGGATYLTGGWDIPTAYNGQDYDATTGLVSYYARTYDTESVSWTGLDMWGGSRLLPQTQGRYRFAISNPPTLIDILGFAPGYSDALPSGTFRPAKRPPYYVATNLPDGSIDYQIAHFAELPPEGIIAYTSYDTLKPMSLTSAQYDEYTASLCPENIDVDNS